MRRRGRRGGRPGLVGTMARTAVVAGTATAVSGGVARRQQAKAVQSQEAQAYEEQQQAPAPAAAPTESTGDVISQLKELAELKNQGILTDAEFEAQKAKILA